MSGPERLGPYTLLQPEGVFPLGEDALLLGAFATVRRGWQVCDLGTGGGCLLLLLAGRAEGLSLFGAERDPAAAQAARENLARNGLTGEIWTGDWGQTPFPPGRFHLVTANPPYFSAGSGGDGGPARMEREAGSLTALCAAAARLLRNGGRFAMCCRPERLAGVFAALQGRGLEPKRLQFAAHSPARPPYLALVEAVRQGRPGLEVLPLTGRAASGCPGSPPPETRRHR